MIREKDYITKDIVELLKEASISSRKACFASATGRHKYLIDITCSSCGKTILMELYKTNILDYLKGTAQYKCDQC